MAHKLSRALLGAAAVASLAATLAACAGSNPSPNSAKDEHKTNPIEPSERRTRR